MSRGGRRQGAGRPFGSLNKVTAVHATTLSDCAREYTEDALLTLVEVAKNGRTDAARVAAATALLDRAYGKPATMTESRPLDLPPVVIELRAAKTDGS